MNDTLLQLYVKNLIKKCHNQPQPLTPFTHKYRKKNLKRSLCTPQTLKPLAFTEVHKDN